MHQTYGKNNLCLKCYWLQMKAFENPDTSLEEGCSDCQCSSSKSCMRKMGLGATRLITSIAGIVNFRKRNNRLVFRARIQRRFLIGCGRQRRSVGRWQIGVVGCRREAGGRLCESGLRERGQRGRGQRRRRQRGRADRWQRNRCNVCGRVAWQRGLCWCRHLAQAGWNRRRLRGGCWRQRAGLGNRIVGINGCWCLRRRRCLLWGHWQLIKNILIKSRRQLLLLLGKSNSSNDQN
ncbi:hypothetical protein BX667DRAFT_503043 [Coemansia mojavensis]|nr:hypothetical protein BX667DRAFT_503043 [Coemansia mojavensis]